MLSNDRTLLSNLVIAVVASTGAALVIGTSCLGRACMQIDPGIDVTIVRERDTSETSAGGVAPNEVHVTSGAIRVEPSSSANGVETPAPLTAPLPTLPRARPQPPPAHTIPPAAIAPMPTPAATTSSELAIVDASLALPDSSAPEAPTPDAAASPEAAAPPPMHPTPAQGGAGTFITEPAPWAASAFASNPEAGAGTFSTDQPR